MMNFKYAANINLDNLHNLYKYFVINDSLPPKEELLKVETYYALMTLTREFNTDYFYISERLYKKYEKVLNAIVDHISVDKMNVRKFYDELFTYLNKKNVQKFVGLKQSFFSKTKPTLKKIFADSNTHNKTGGKRGQKYYNSPIMNNYNGILNCSAFRRLQTKAQVYSLELGDFVRTRLTHSIEVSGIAERIIDYIPEKVISILFNDNNDKKEDKMFTNRDTIKAIIKSSALLHDIGNPSFGHYGECIINDFFKNYKNIGTLKESKHSIDVKMFEDIVHFDGNAQGIRIALKLQNFGNNYGLSLPMIILASNIKTPFSVNDLSEENNKIGYFISEEDEIEFLSFFDLYKTGKRFCFASLLEAADDISYVTSDLEDAIHKGIISCDDVLKVLDAKGSYEGKTNEEKEKTIQAKFAIFKVDLVKYVAREFSRRVKEEEKEKDGDSFNKELLDSHGQFNELKSIMKKIYVNKEISLKELKGKQILTFLLENYSNAVLESDDNLTTQCKTSKKIISLISKDFINVYHSEKELFRKNVKFKNNGNLITYLKIRLVIDEISGMTDTHAQNLYQILKGIK